ncbi:MAG TPA: rod shape-determining protein RodA [Clostridiales bacterium]|nr:MAG: rod shape-determining protein RodA [Clostridiales bacterium GWD2_32_19]HCC06855.1 rod shape-determining protein RodA [Clostridiales bacterium]
MMFQRIKHIDKVILGLILFLVAISIIAITSATRANITGDYSYVIKQCMWFGIGFVAMLFIIVYDFSQFDENFRMFGAIVIYFLNIALLVFVLFIGTTAKGAERWIEIVGFRFQPSEFAKVIMIFCIAVFLSKSAENINKIWVLAINLILLAIPMILIIIQPSLSTSLVFIAIFAAQIFVADIDYKYIIFGVVLVVLLLFALRLDAKQEDPIFLRDYQAKRILALFEPDKYQKEEAYQTRKSVEAIGSGQLAGKGIYKGNLNKAEYLPEPHTDFIFSIIAEESGFLMCAMIIIIYALLIYRIVDIALRVSDKFKKYLVVGVAAMIAFQAFVNIGVVSGMLPSTGMPLPFLSYGGSSMITNMIAIGMVLNLDTSSKNRYMLI